MAQAMTAKSRHVKDDRKTLLRELLKVAGIAGVAVVRDDAGKAKVTTMMMDIRAASGLGAAALKSPEGASQRYERTFGADTDHKQPEGFRLREISFLLTYNWDYLNKQAFPEWHPSP